MASDFLELGIVVARREPARAWASPGWHPVAVLPAAPDLAPGTPLGEGNVYAGSVEVSLYQRATGHYRDNLASGRPCVWVALRPQGDGFELGAAALDPYEGEAMADSVGEVVEALAMPAAVAGRLAAFVAAFPIEEPFIKRQRDRADPEALARRGLVPRKDEG